MTWDGGSQSARARPERPASCIRGSRCWYSAIYMYDAVLLHDSLPSNDRTDWWSYPICISIFEFLFPPGSCLPRVKIIIIIIIICRMHNIYGAISQPSPEFTWFSSWICTCKITPKGATDPQSKQAELGRESPFWLLTFIPTIPIYCP